MADDRVLQVQVARIVTDEVVRQVAPLRDQVQIARGETAQLNRDLTALRGALEELKLVVYGDQRMNLVGVPQQIVGLRTAVTNEIVGVDRKVVIVDEKVETLSDQYTAIKNQIRGARWAFLVLAGLMGWQPLLALAKLLGIAP